MLAGVTSLFSRDPARDFAYSVGDPVVSLDNKSVWSLHKAQKKATKNDHAAFVYHIERGSAHGADLAKQSVKQLKMLRHPNILVFVDSLETDKVIYMITEACVPLFEYLDKLPEKLSEDITAWGLYQVLKGLEFINEQCNLCHNAVSTASIFVTRAGEWKLGGFEYVTAADQPNTSKKHLKGVEVFEAPEISANHATKPVNTWSTDMWSYGAVTYEVFNGKLYDKQSLKNVLSIPSTFRATYSELIASNPAQRPSPSQILERCTKPGGFFNNDFLNTMKELDEIHVKTPEEKSRLLRRLNVLLDVMPAELSRSKVVPALVGVFDFGTPDYTVLPVLLKIGVLMQPEEFQKRIVPCVVKLFASPDRATRIHLLQNLKSYADHLSKAVVNKDIFQHVCMGFLDTNPAMREETVKAMSLLAPKLDYKNLNEELMKYFARVQAQDEEGPIRTNTTICIAKIAPCLTPETRDKVLPSAFTRALRDPFEPARIAGIAGFMETHEYFTIKDTALKIVPVLCTATVDADKKVRDQGFKAIENLMERLRQVSEKPELLEQYESKVKAGSTSVVNQLASSWIGAAVTSMAARFKQQKAEAAAESAVSAGGGSASKTTAAAASDASKSSDLSPENDAGDADDFSFSSRTPSPMHVFNGKAITTTGAPSKPTAASHVNAAGNKNSSAVSNTGVNRSLLVPTPASSAAAIAKQGATNKPHRKTSASEAAKTSWENDLWLSLDEPSVAASAAAADSPSPSSGTKSSLAAPASSASMQSFQGWDEESSGNNGLTPTTKPNAAGINSGGNSWAAWNDSPTLTGAEKLTETSAPLQPGLLQPVSINNSKPSAKPLAGNMMMPTTTAITKPSPASTGGGWNDDFFDKMLTSPSGGGSTAVKKSNADNWDPFGAASSDSTINNNSAQSRRPNGSAGGKPMKLSAKRIG